jgi:hypothetical protein
MLRFSLRDVFWMTLVAMMGLGWGLEHWLLYTRMQTVKKLHPMLYEAMTGENVDTNNLKPINQPFPQP